MNAKTRRRKDARTRIYRAVFGPGGREHNIPWTDAGRKRSQGWSQSEALATFHGFKDYAELSRGALVSIASTLGVSLNEVL